MKDGFALPENVWDNWGEGGGAVLQNSRIDLSIVRQPTATNNDGEVENLPASVDWVHEWESLWVELWVSSPDAPAAIAGATVDLHYDSGYLTAQDIVFGSAFMHERAGTIDDASGRVGELGGWTKLDHLGGDCYLLLARVRFASTGDDQVPVDPVGRNIGPYDMQMALANGQTELMGGESVIAELGESPATELWGMVYDASDTDQVDFGDLSFFAGNFGADRTTVQTGSKTITFPPNFPDAYRPLNVAPVAEDNAVPKYDVPVPSCVDNCPG